MSIALQFSNTRFTADLRGVKFLGRPARFPNSGPVVHVVSCEMSKFFAKGSSDSESEEEETSSEEESSEDEKPVKKAGASRPEETVRRGPRKVVSAKDKRFDEMRQTVKQLKNAIKINDWNAISNG